MARRKTAYDLPPGPVKLSSEARFRALVWWQAGYGYQPLNCPVCKKRLSPQEKPLSLECRTPWCTYSTEEIPWGVFVAWQESRRSEGETMPVTIYHNPRCSKSRETLRLLKDRNIEPQVIDYLKEPPDEEQLKVLLKQLGLEPQKIIRFKELRAKELVLSPEDDRSEEEWIRLLVENPRLLERPIVVANKKAALGRPPETVLEIL